MRILESTKMKMMSLPENQIVAVKLSTAKIILNIYIFTFCFIISAVRKPIYSYLIVYKWLNSLNFYQILFVNFFSQ